MAEVNNNNITNEITAVQNKLNSLDQNNPANENELTLLKGQLRILQNRLEGNRGSLNNNEPPSTSTTTNNNQNQSVETDAGRGLLQQAIAILSSVLNLFHTTSADPHALLPMYQNAIETDEQGVTTAIEAKAVNPNLVEEATPVIAKGYTAMGEHKTAYKEQAGKIRADQNQTEKEQSITTKGLV